MYVCVCVCIYPLQVQDCSHLCEASKLVSDGPGGDGGEVGHQRTQLPVKLQTAQLHRDKMETWLQKTPGWRRKKEREGERRVGFRMGEGWGGFGGM